MSQLKTTAQRHLTSPRPGVLSVVTRLPDEARHLVWRAANGAPSRVIAVPSARAAQSDAELLDYGVAQLTLSDRVS
jgi:hypothetical protein